MDWPQKDFARREDAPLSGPGALRRGTMQLAEKRVTLLGKEADGSESGAGPEDGGKEPPFRAREIRRLTATGRQLACVTTHPSLPLERVAGALAHDLCRRQSPVPQYSWPRRHPPPPLKVQAA